MNLTNIIRIVVACLLLLCFSCAPAYHAQRKPLQIMPPGTTCRLATTPPEEITYTQPIFPATREQINACNSCQRTNAELTAILEDCGDSTERVVTWTALGTSLGLVVGIITGLLVK